MENQNLAQAKVKSMTGGNGMKTPLPVRYLYQLLNGDWEIEYAIKTGHNQWDGSGYPTCYKVDLADPVRKIAIEVDGQSHGSLERKQQDQKKTVFLERLGWKVYRIKNKQVLSLCTICTCPDIRHILQEVF
jgi:hypothetical protein